MRRKKMPNQEPSLTRLPHALGLITQTEQILRQAIEDGRFGSGRLPTEALRSHSFRVPEDVSIVGGGGEEIAGLTCHQADWPTWARLPCKFCSRKLLGQSTIAAFTPCGEG